MVPACLDASTRAKSDRVVNVAQLSNEIHWLRILLKRMRPDLSSFGDTLAAHYIEFKKHLTESDSADIISASNAGNEIRMTALNIQWRLCQHVLDRPTDADIFAPH